MDILEDKTTKTYYYNSRYATFYYYYNTEDDKYIYGLTSWLDTDATTYVLHKITQQDTLESLAYQYYNNPSYYWIIADFNRITDPFVELYGNYDSLQIPSMSSITWEY